MNKTTARVLARNLACKKINLYTPKVQQFLQNWIGKKVINKDGSLVAKLKKDMESFAFGLIEKQIVIDFSRYNVSIEIIAYGGDTKCTVMESVKVYIGVIDDGELVGLKEFDKIREDWTVNDVEEARERVKIAKREYDEAVSALSWFGISDY